MLIYLIFVVVLQTATKIVEPIDYETVIVKNKTLLTNDPQREMLLFPHDDLSVGLLIADMLYVCAVAKWLRRSLRTFHAITRGVQIQS